MWKTFSISPPSLPLLLCGLALAGSGIGNIERKADDVLNEIRVLIQCRAYRIVQLRLEIVTPFKEILGLPSDLCPTCKSTVAFDTCIGTLPFRKNPSPAGIASSEAGWEHISSNPGVAVSVNRANILKADVWKAHSGDVPAGVDLVNTSGDSDSTGATVEISF